MADLIQEQSQHPMHQWETGQYSNLYKNYEKMVLVDLIREKDIISSRQVFYPQKANDHAKMLIDYFIEQKQQL